MLSTQENKAMKKDWAELRARQWLESQGYTEIRDLSEAREDPPDFLVDNRIAVEVRRLSWMTDADPANPKQSAEGLEKRLDKAIGKVLEEVGETPGGHDVYVWCDLLRDVIPETGITRTQVGKAVKAYIKILSEALRSEGHPVKWWTELECGMSICFYPSSMPKSGKFVLEQVAAVPSSRGLVVANSIDNINRCIVDKTGKIKGRICKYCEWWLVLVDHELFTPLKFERDEWQQIRNGLVDTDPWSRIVVISWYEPLANYLIHVDLIQKGN